MPLIRTISLALVALAGLCTGCAIKKSDPLILSGGDFYPNGLTATGEALYAPDIPSRQFSGPHYVIPEETLNALVTPPQ